MAVYEEEQEKKKEVERREQKEKEELQKAAEKELSRKRKIEEGKKKKIKDEEDAKQAKENARVAAINAKKRARLLKDLYALSVLIILYVLLVATLMTLVIPIQSMADKFVNILSDKNNSSWIALGTLLYMTIFGYYFYSKYRVLISILSNILYHKVS